MKLQNERLQQADAADLARERLGVEQRQALCAGALGYLQDDTPNAALPPAEAQLLLADMRRTASACSASTPRQPAASEGRRK